MLTAAPNLAGAHVEAAPTPLAAKATPEPTPEPAPEPAQNRPEPAPEPALDPPPAAKPEALAVKEPKFEDFPPVQHKPREIVLPLKGSAPTAVRSPARKPHVPRQGGHPSDVKPADPYHRSAYDLGDDGGMHDALVAGLGGAAAKPT